MLSHDSSGAATPVTFKTVFDAGSHGYSTWYFPAIGMIFIGFGALFAFKPTLVSRFRVRNAGPVRPPLIIRFIRRWYLLAFGILWTSIALNSTYREYLAVSSALRDRTYQVVEGPVTNYVPMPSNGHGDESFTVNGVSFGYSDYDTAIGFHQTASRGGPIREGLFVRVTYLDNLILRLEVAK